MGKDSSQRKTVAKCSRDRYVLITRKKAVSQVIISHKIQLDTTVKQRSYFARAAGTSRLVYNWALEEWNRQYAAGENPTASKLKLQFNTVKYDLFPWLKDIHRDAHSQPFANLGTAFTNFFKKNANRPMFHKKGRNDSFYVANDRFRVDGLRIRLPVIGWVRLAEQLRFVGRIMSATVSRTANRWFISIQVDVGDYERLRVADGVIGIDLGLNSLATLSTGEKIEGPRSLKSNLNRLRRASRSHSRKQKGSNNRRKSASRLARIHARISNIRNDFLHKLTTRLCRENQAIAIEDLAVKNMSRNRKLARGISDAAWGEIRRQLAYKTPIFKSVLKVVDRFFPSSKRCSRCHEMKSDLQLSDRVFRCEHCGLEIDRDENAALNIRTEGFSGIYAWGDCGAGVGTGVRRETAVNEPRTKPCMCLCTN